MKKSGHIMCTAYFTHCHPCYAMLTYKKFLMCAAKVRGAKRFQSSWNDELKQGLITEIFDTPEDYMAFFSHVDTSKMACIDFKGITISCSRADLPALDSLLSGFPFQVFLTDGCAGDEKMY